MELQILVSLCKYNRLLVPVELNLDENVVLKMCKKNVLALCTLTTFSIALYWFQSCSRKAFMAWELHKATEEECQRYHMIRKWREEMQTINSPPPSAVANGWITGPWGSYLAIMKEWRSTYRLSAELRVQQLYPVLMSSNFIWVEWI